MPVKKKSIEKKIDSIDKRISKIESEEKTIEQVEKKVEEKISEIVKGEQNVERAIIQFGRFSFKKKHLLELTRASAGAFLGVGIGRGLIGLDNIAKNLAWLNVIGILFFILIISSLLVYRDEKKHMPKVGPWTLTQRLLFIYFISVSIEFISLLLFNVQYDSPETLIKIIIVGSYTAMASAITFSLAE